MNSAGQFDQCQEASRKHTFSNSSLNLLENQQVSISIPTTDGLREHQRMLVGQRLEGHFNGSARAGFRCNYLPPPILAPSANLQRHIMSPNTTQLSIVTSQGTIDQETVSNVHAKKEATCSNWLMHVYLTPHLTSLHPTWMPRFF